MAPPDKARLEAVWLLLGGLLLFYVSYVVLQEGLRLAALGRYTGILRISPLLNHSLVAFALLASAVSMLVMVVRKYTMQEDEGSGGAL
jgi:hypothetical protein